MSNNSTVIRAGATGKALLNMLQSSLMDYPSFFGRLPGLSAAERWVVLSKSKSNHEGEWVIAPLKAVLESKTLSPTTASPNRFYRHSRNFHPALWAIREIIAIINGELRME